MSLSLTVDAKEVTKGLDKISKSLDDEITKELEKISNKILKEAKNNHRFKSRTGNLLAATKKELGIDKNSINEVFKIDDIKAPYGSYIHEGFRGWSADKYLENAVVRNEDNMEKAVEKGIDNAIKKAGF